MPAPRDQPEHKEQETSLDRMVLFGDIARRSRRVISGYFKRLLTREGVASIPETWVMTGALRSLAWHWLKHPGTLLRAQAAFSFDAGELMLRTARRFWLGKSSPFPLEADRRFKELTKLYIDQFRDTMTSMLELRGSILRGNLS